MMKVNSSATPEMRSTLYLSTQPCAAVGVGGGGVGSTLIAFSVLATYIYEEIGKPPSPHHLDLCRKVPT